MTKTVSMVVSAAGLIWIGVLITWVTIKIFSDPVNIPTGTVAAYGTLVGLPTIIIGFYKWVRRPSRNKDKQEKIINTSE